MDKMLLQTSLSFQGVTMATTAVASTPATSTSDWRQQLPVLAGEHVTLREVEVEDAPALMEFAQNDQGGCLMCGFTPKLAANSIRARGQA